MARILSQSCNASPKLVAMNSQGNLLIHYAPIEQFTTRLKEQISTLYTAEITNNLHIGIE
ncbi:MAG: hypothetical protein LBU90_10295 [Bacteroidales bacterium]|nr:hypothetical protein [Bacteroidales bacterium]